MKLVTEQLMRKDSQYVVSPLLWKLILRLFKGHPEVVRILEFIPEDSFQNHFQPGHYRVIQDHPEVIQIPEVILMSSQINSKVIPSTVAIR